MIDLYLNKIMCKYAIVAYAMFTVGIKIFHDSNLWDFKWNSIVIGFTFADLADVWRENGIFLCLF